MPTRYVIRDPTTRPRIVRAVAQDGASYPSWDEAAAAALAALEHERERLGRQADRIRREGYRRHGKTPIRIF